MSEMLTIGILNSMPEAAIRSTERQFAQVLLNAAIPDVPLRLRWYSLHPRDRYLSVNELWRGDPVDGLIVTGTEPRARLLRDEPYWDSIARTIEWATTNTVSTFWSCLAAHAAVLQLDGVERRALPDKLCGVFETETVEDHPILANMNGSWGVPHSRFNDLSPSSLSSRGYRLLTLSTRAGVDIFVKGFRRSLFVFSQGHLEYDARALMREYRRDVLRFVAGERDRYPDVPTHYFDDKTVRGLEALRERALRERNPDVMVDLQVLVGKAELSGPWEPIAVRLYRNWLGLLIAERASHALSQVVL